MDSLISLVTGFLISWAPFLLILGTIIYFVRGASGKQAREFEQIGAYLSEHIAEVRRLNVNLESILAGREVRGNPKAPHNANEQ